MSESNLRPGNIRNFTIKGEDLSGAGGGKKAWFFGNLRRKWNQKKQDRLRGESERLSQEKHDAEDKAIAEYNLKKKQEK